MDMIKLAVGLSKLGPAAFILWGLFLFSAIRKPYRLRNIIYLILAVVTTLFFTAAFMGKYMQGVLSFLGNVVFAALYLMPVLLIINGVVMLRNEAHSAGNILSLLLGLVLGIGELSDMIYMYNIGGYVLHIDDRLLWIIHMSVLYMSLLVFAFALYCLFVNILPHSKDFNYIIIHGSGLIRGREVPALLGNRIDKAMQMYRLCGERSVLIPSGGQGADEEISEASAMEAYLLAHGISRETIVLEDHSRTTMENLRFSKGIIDDRPGRKKTALVTSNYHVYRCMRYAQSIGLECHGIGAPVAAYFWPSAMLREFVAIFSSKESLPFLILGYLFVVGIPIALAFV